MKQLSIFKSKKNDIFKIISSMMIISMLGKFLGLIREILFAKKFGAQSIAGTAFIYASSIPNYFFDIMFASSINSSFVPIFNKKLENKNNKEAFKLFNNFLNILIIISIFIILLSILFSSKIINFLATGLDLKTQVLSSQLIKITSPSILFSVLAFSVTGFLQTFNEFNIPSSTSIVFNLTIIFYYLFFIEKFGVFGLAWSSLFAWSLQFLIQIPFLKKYEYKHRFYINFKSKDIKNIFKSILPIMISSWITPINNLINARAASYINGGGVALQKANSIYTISAGTFILSINNYVFQKLSKIKVKNNHKEFDKFLFNAIKITSLFSILILVFLLIFSRSIIKILFEHGNFNSHDTGLTSRALFYYSWGIFGYAIQTILNSAFYSQRKLFIPLISSIISFLINFILSFKLLKILDIGGPAFSFSVSSVISMLFSLIFYLSFYKNQRKL
ncbi:MAG: murein biosynthesis integral membrane protein MurJ [Clostridiales bacterium]|jgi:murein biosynthesis integral membrane protein MurJ|nr:murein biosynthesis integral membrane protein MurJ [Clostridiales bacterium]